MDNISVEIYSAKDSNLPSGKVLPTILVLQGVEVDQTEYSTLANNLASAGFSVIVPNFVARSGDYVCPDNSSVARFLASQQSQKVQELLTGGLVLLGHSAGGYAAFGALMTESPGLAQWPTAIVTYGATAPFFDALQQELPPTLMIAGLADTIVPVQTTREGFDDLPSSRKTLISLSRFHHYSITDSGAPQYAPEEESQKVPYGHTAIAILTQIICPFILHALENKAGWTEELPAAIALEIDSIESA